MPIMNLAGTSTTSIPQRPRISSTETSTTTPRDAAGSWISTAVVSELVTSPSSRFSTWTQATTSVSSRRVPSEKQLHWSFSVIIITVLKPQCQYPNIYRPRRRSIESSNRRCRQQKKIMLDRVVCSCEHRTVQFSDAP